MIPTYEVELNEVDYLVKMFEDRKRFSLHLNELSLLWGRLLFLFFLRGVHY